ncbi:MAG: twin-arginine translocase subunit TatC [Bacteroidetes bacterium]|nr:twin-arginine translocase subunit TatC [Bacteroidota bacterium]
MSFIEHLEELRWHIMRAVLVILGFTILVFVAKSFVFDTVIFGPKNTEFLSYRALCWLSYQIGLGESMCIVPPDFAIANFSMMGEFMAHMQISLIIGFVISFPYILWEFWRFIRPGLYEKEIRTTQGLVGYCSMLFLLGISFGYFIIVPFSINFLVPYSISDQVADYIQLSDYISFMAMTVLAAGIMFELPMIIYFLAKLGIVSAAFLRSYRRHAIIIILVVSAVITPPDALSQILIFLPVQFLYEIGIVIASRIEKKRLKEDLERYGS